MTSYVKTYRRHDDLIFLREGRKSQLVIFALNIYVNIAVGKRYKVRSQFVKIFEDDLENRCLKNQRREDLIVPREQISDVRLHSAADVRDHQNIIKRKLYRDKKKKGKEDNTEASRGF